MAQQSQTITASSGSNLAASFSFLKKEQRHAMSVFYAFCRVVDDIADDTATPVAAKLEGLADWHRQIQECYQGNPSLPLAKELVPVIRDYSIPEELLQEIILGVEMDAHQPEYETWEDLRLYCHRVASCVGLVSIKIFECRHPRSTEYAEQLGLAFQTTNILRDVRTDLGYGRIYLPAEDFERAGCTRDDLRKHGVNDNLRHLYRIMAERSQHYYSAADRVLPPSDRPRLLAAQIMRGVYYEVLERIRGRNFDVWHHATKFSKLTKVRLMHRAWRAESRWLKKGPAPTPQKRVVVLGGGLAGLAASVELARSGHKVTLVEARQTLGGRAHSYRDPKTGDILDNGQHILMGCYTETLQFLKEIGSAHLLQGAPRLRLHYASEKFGVTRLAAPPLPYPLHLLGAIAFFPEMSAKDRLAVIEAGAGAALSKPGQWKSSTVAEWLLANRQTPGSIRGMWEPFCAAALNETVQDASAELFVETVRRAFASSPAHSAILLPSVGLSDLFAKRASDILLACGGEILTGQSVVRLDFDGGLVQRAVLGSAKALPAEAVVSALPWHGLRNLLPRESKLRGQIEQIQGSPIIAIHLWFDRPICREPIIGFLDSPIQWAFNRVAIHGSTESGWPSLSLVISAAEPHMNTPSLELVELALKECRRFLPVAREANLMHQFVYRAKEATFRAIPSMLPLRPDTRTEWGNFLLAGDWTNTGLPSTIEGAVLSGRRAARALA